MKSIKKLAQETCASFGLFDDISFGMNADLFDLGLETFQIPEGVRTLADIPQERRGVIHGHKPDAAFFCPLTMVFGDAEVFPNQLLGGNSPQADDDFRPDELCLHPQPGDAGFLLCLQGISVLRRTALDDITDVAVLTAETDDGKHIVEELTGRADERFALQVLLLTGAFADEHDFCVVGACAEDYMMPCLAKVTAIAVHTGLFQ